MDIGGHRFFSKSDRVMAWWLNILPMQGAPAWDDRVLGREVELATTVDRREVGADVVDNLPAPDPEQEDAVMLVRRRLSRILFLRKFFDYPISLSKNTIVNLGAARMTRMVGSYLSARCFPRKNVQSLEDFFINQFGTELYRTFFQDYTEKVWGVPCREIPADWGAQRVKGLSLARVIGHALRGMTARKSVTAQQQVETSLIESFIYPKYGPGQLWETVAATVQQHGAELHLHTRVVGVATEGERITGIEVERQDTGERTVVPGDYLLSSMPVRELIASFRTPAPEEVGRVAAGLQYRDFMTVGVLAKRLLLKNTTERATVNDIVPDNWIYVQEPDVRVGRLQTVQQLEPVHGRRPRTHLAGHGILLSGRRCHVATAGHGLFRLRHQRAGEDRRGRSRGRAGYHGAARAKSLPGIFRHLPWLPRVRDFTDRFANLFLIGRNGMHRYNNMDHSMLAAMTAVENIISGRADKANLWTVNAEEEYHEAK